MSSKQDLSDSSSVFLLFEAKFVDSNLTEHEQLGTMSGWSSSYRESKDGFVKVSMNAQEPFKIKIQISKNTKTVPIDSRAWFELLVGIENYEGRI